MVAEDWVSRCTPTARKCGKNHSKLPDDREHYDAEPKRIEPILCRERNLAWHEATVLALLTNNNCFLRKVELLDHGFAAFPNCLFQATIAMLFPPSVLLRALLRDIGDFGIFNIPEETLQFYVPVLKQAKQAKGIKS